MKKVFRIFLGIGIIVLFVGTFAFLYLNSRPKVKEYETLEPSRRDIIRSTVVTGKIEPRDEVAVKPQISGIVAELFKEAGQHVEAGEVIARVKVIPDMQQLSSAESRVRLATINVRQTTKDHERQKTLFDKGLISANEYEKARQAYDQAREELAAAQDNLEVVRDGASRSNASASNTLVRSTISGIILDIPVKVGNSVILSNTFNEGTTIATVADMGNLIFRGNIDETEVGRLRPGMNMRITIGAMQDVSFDAALEYISPKATEQGGANQFEIKAAVNIPAATDTSDGAGIPMIRSGYSANAQIVLEEVHDVLTIPEAAVHFEGDSTFVYLLHEDSNGKQYVPANIVTGLSDGINIEIKSGIEPTARLRGNEVIATTE